MADASSYHFQSATVPAAYDKYFVPRLFAPWARVLLDSIELKPGDHVLDVACGPGLVACALAEIARQVTGLDLTPAMIEQSKALQQSHRLAKPST